MALLLSGLLAGTFIGSTMVEHAARMLNASNWIAYKQAKEVTFAAVMPASLLLTIVALAAATVAGSATRTSWSFGFAALCLLGVLVITVVVHLPINKFIQAASQDLIPAAWDEQRRRWRGWNLARCALAILAFALALFGFWKLSASLAHG